MRRPSVFFLLAFCAGIWWALGDVRPALFLSLILVLSMLFDINMKKIITLVIGVVLGFGMTSVHVQKLESENLRLTELIPFQMSGTVYQREVLDQTSAWLKTDQNLWLKLKFSSFAPMPEFSPGSRIVVQGLYMPGESARNPGGFHEKRWLYSKKATGSIMVKHIEIVGNGSWLELWRHKIGNALAGSLLQNTAFHQGPMAAGMLLGEDSWIPETVIQAYLDSGTNHILSVSGAHFGVLLFWIYRLTEKKSFSYLTKKIGIWAVLGLFIWVIGADSAAMRAYVMFIVLDGARLCYKQPDGFNCLCIAVSLILLSNPLMIWDIGLQLAFSAMYGLLVLKPFLSQFIKYDPKRLMGRVLDALISSFSVSISLYPILCNQFNTFSWYSLFYNIPVAFISGICLPLALLVALFYGFTPLARVIGIFSGSGLWLMSGLVRTSSYLPKSQALPSLTAVEFSVYIGLLLMPLYFIQIGAGVMKLQRLRHVQRQHFHRLKAFGYLVLLVAAFLYTPSLSEIKMPSEELRISYLDVGQGDGTVIQTPEGASHCHRCRFGKGKTSSGGQSSKIGH